MCVNKLIVLGITLFVLAVPVSQAQVDTALAHAYFIKSACFAEESKTDSALYYQILAHQGFEIKNQKNRAAECSVHSIRYLINLDRFNEADFLLKSTLSSLRADLDADTNSSRYAKVLCAEGLLFYRQNRVPEAKKSYLRALSIFERLLNFNYQKLAEVYNNVGMVLQHLHEFSDAKVALKKAIHINTQFDGFFSSSNINPFTNLGIVEFRLQNLDKAAFYFNHALEISKKNNGENHDLTARCCTNLARVFTRKGDMVSAEECYEETIRIRSSIFGEDHPKLIEPYSHLAFAMGNQGKLEEAIEVQKRCAKLAQTYFGLRNQVYLDNQRKLAILYFRTEHFDSAFKLISNIYEIESIQDFAQISNDPGILNYLGLWQSKLQNFGLASDIRGEAIKQEIEKHGSKHYAVAKSYSRLSRVYRMAGKLDSAIVANNSALEANALNFEYQSGNLSALLDHDILNHHTLVEILNARSLILSLMIEDTKDILLCHELMDITKLRLPLAREIHSQTAIRQANDYAGFNSEQVYFEALRSMDQLHSIGNKRELNQWTYQCIEESKWLSLSGIIRASGVSEYKNVSAPILNLQKTTNKALVNAEKQRFEAEQVGRKDSLLVALNTSILQHKHRLDSIARVIKKSNPRFHQSFFNTQITSLDEVQKKLDTETSIVEYLVGNDHVYMLLINSDSVIFKQVLRDSLFEDRIHSFRRHIYGDWLTGGQKSSSGNQGQKAFVSEATELYDILLRPFETNLKKHLVIVPDKELHFVPFEALIKSRPPNDQDIKTYDYVLKNHVVQYQHSVTLYSELKKKRGRSRAKGIMAMAPSYLDESPPATDLMAVRSGLRFLKYNVSEVEEINKITSADLFVGENATKTRFLEEASKYQIIHLSTHGKANDPLGDYSFIAFTESNDSTDQDYKLYVRELYNMDLNADMVVLSACETGIGEIKRGEGIVGMGRGFAHAGARSIVSSLWNVNDAQTAGLMAQFYQNLKAGLRKDEALREAKLTYLKNEWPADPFFWAGFVAMGDMAPIDLDGSNRKFWWLGLLIIVALGLLYQKNRKRPIPEAA